MFEVVVFAFTAFVVGFSGAIVPGPMLTVSITESLKKKDYKAGTSVVIGHVMAEAGIVTLIGLGLSQIIGLRGDVYSHLHFRRRSTRIYGI